MTPEGTGPGTDAGVPVVYDLELTACDETVYLGRRLVEQAADRWRLDHDMADDLKVIATEFLTNAARAVEGTVVKLLIERSISRADAVKVQVWDRSPFPPRVITADPLDENGRGLSIVTIMCGRQNTGWEPTGSPPGKWVWAIRSADVDADGSCPDGYGGIGA